MSAVQTVALWLLGLAFVGAGMAHFRNPAFYLSMMPPWLPAPALLVQVSGVFEVLGGIGVLVPATRTFSGWGLVALLVAVFPANVHMAMHPDPAAQGNVPAAMLWLRLPLQGVIIAWVVWAAKLWR
jgi:uncharacterized membrane protein